MDLRDAIQRIALEWPSYGRPRITAELRRRGWKVNHKRVHRLMREDNLLCVRKRKFVVTTDSNHGRRVYPNLARQMIADRRRSTVGGRHHLHPAAGGVRVPGGDSGRLLAPRDRLGAGSHAGRRADAGGAAHGAGTPGRPAPGWCTIPIAASQYASSDYTDLLKDHGIRHQHESRKGNPWDNAACESFMKTLKYEEVYRNEYRDLAEARASIARVPREGLQPEAAALGAGLPCRRRSSKRICGAEQQGCRFAAAFVYEFSQASGDLSIRWGRRARDGRRPRSSSG